jgi:hypothetical protein
MTRALHFFAVVGAMHDLIGTERPGHAHVGFVTQHIVGACQLSLDRRHHQLCGTWPQADDCQTPARTADGQWV